VTLFYPGVHQPSLAANLDRCILSYNVLERRKSDFVVRDWLLDSGAFTRMARGVPHVEVEAYAAAADRWASCGRLEAVVCQDWMCEPWMVSKTGLTVREHQVLTTDAYESLRALTAVPVMAVVQGYAPSEYGRHAAELASVLDADEWVGVGSVCKRQGSADDLVRVLDSILEISPDWRLHGFGVKMSSLGDSRVRARLATADSMAWSWEARRRRLSGEDWPSANSVEACLMWMDRLEAAMEGPDVEAAVQLSLLPVLAG